jgi:hypothetical protein
LLSQRIKCAGSKSWCLGMLRECLVYSSMCLGVPFIAPRQLGDVECIPGRQFLPSVAWRTGHCPVHTGQSGAPFRPLAQPRVSRGSRGRPLAHRTVRCTPDSPVNYSRTPLITSREQQVRLSQPGTPDTVRCTTEQSRASRQS